MTTDTTLSPSTLSPSNSVTTASFTTGSLLNGRTALVTGSTSGIGAATARALAAEGAVVAVSGRDAARGAAVVHSITSAGGEACFVPVDLGGSYEDLRQLVTEATSALGGRIDVLVNNAGIYPATSTAGLADVDLDEIGRAHV